MIIILRRARVVSFMGLSVPRSFQASVTWRPTSDRHYHISENHHQSERYMALVDHIPLSQAPPPCRCSR